MKILFKYVKCLSFLLFISLITSCSGNREENENCKFLFNVGVSEVINLSLPAYSQLQFPGNSVYYPSGGNGGILIASTGADFFAWDASDPNHTQQSCSVMAPSGLNAVCNCDDKNEYSLVTGLPVNNPSLVCPLKNYRVEKSGNSLIISN